MCLVKDCFHFALSSSILQNLIKMLFNLFTKKDWLNQVISKVLVFKKLLVSREAAGQKLIKKLRALFWILNTVIYHGQPKRGTYFGAPSTYTSNWDSCISLMLASRDAITRKGQYKPFCNHDYSAKDSGSTKFVWIFIQKILISL